MWNISVEMPPPTSDITATVTSPPAASAGTRLPAGSWSDNRRRSPAANTSAAIAITVVRTWKAQTAGALPSSASATFALSMSSPVSTVSTPLTITEEELGEGFAIIDRALEITDAAVR